ncbi:MAG: YifB family Mg chelatase-like AAA ATPase, partial [Dehalococcoidia bacterium]
MLTRSRTCALLGLDGTIVDVEVDISPGLPAFTVVGLPDASVQEARERVRAAIRNSGFEFPMRRITVSLAPADLRKEGPSYDLPMAVGILASSGQLQADLSTTALMGELSLEGQLRHTDGVLPMAGLARDKGLTTVAVPETDAAEAALVEGVDVLPVATLRQLVEHLRGDESIPVFSGATRLSDPVVEHAVDLIDIRGQEHAKRALEIAAAGAHNVLMSGPPGSGKTLLARAMASIMPPMSPEEALQTTKVYSVAGMLPADAPLVATRPFRSPHHTISNAGLVGGGRIPRPGEVSLSNAGVLFLDEVPEFGPSVLEVLRQPMEDKVVTISRAHGSVTYPANFMLVGAMNPCFCGNLGDPVKMCTCTSSMVARYQKRISGPLLDRIDIHVEVPRVEFEKLTGAATGERSADVRCRVAEARCIQQRRFEGTRLQTNADMGPAEVLAFCGLDEAA